MKLKAPRNPLAGTRNDHAIDHSEVAFYRRNGYLIHHEQLLPAAKFSGLKEFFEGLLADLPHGKRPEAMDVPHFSFPQLLEWLLAEEVLDFVECFMGPDIVLWSSHFICKPGGDGKAVPWHEDSAYWKDILGSYEVMTVWLAIDDSTVENGCMRVIPGSHDHGFSDYVPVDKGENVFGTEIVSDQVDEGRAVDLEIRAGECHLHHAKMIHGSKTNGSSRRRCGYTMRYMPASVKFHGEKHGGFGHGIYLARGRDLAGNDYLDPSKPAPEFLQRRWEG